ncbi:MAG: oligosaccharide flippase family protein [Pseudomonadota bacterium]|nr:oligosaccharide flippase family protein [Pseudomonadota bacterium]
MSGSGAVLTAGGKATKKQLRGSALLLGGRLIAVGVNFLIQVLIVHHLSKADFGAWSYVLALVAFFQTFVTLGLKRSITRFIPIYHEKGEYAKLFGTILLALGVIVSVGALIILAVYTWPQAIGGLINDTGQLQGSTTALLLIMIFLVPIEAIDGLLIGLFASFTHSRAIFFRRYVVAPALKLGVVLLLIAFGSGVAFLAYGYMAASLLGIGIFGWLFYRMLRQNGVADHFSPRAVSFPVREIFSFTIPLLTTDLLMVGLHSTDVLMLGYFAGATEVAAYRVILPAADVNTIVMSAFVLLYMPIAARLFAKEDYSGINDLYWRTAIWLTVLSFPVFAVTFALARPFVLTVYGDRYADSWVYLQILSLAYYFNVVLGFNGITLKVLGRLRYMVTINVLALVLNVLLNLLLIPGFGALGAALATAGTMMAHNLLKQAGLALVSGIEVFNRRYLWFYGMVGIFALGLFLVQRYGDSPLYFLLPAIAVLSLLLLKISERDLKVADTFPELLRLPLMRFVLSTAR